MQLLLFPWTNCYVFCPTFTIFTAPSPFLSFGKLLFIYFVFVCMKTKIFWQPSWSRSLDQASPTRNINTNINIIRYSFPNRRLLLFTTTIYIYMPWAKARNLQYLFTVHIYIRNSLDLLAISRWCLTMQPSPRQWSSGLWHCPSCNWAATTVTGFLSNPGIFTNNSTSV